MNIKDFKKGDYVIRVDNIAEKNKAINLEWM